MSQLPPPPPSPATAPVPDAKKGLGKGKTAALVAAGLLLLAAAGATAVIFIPALSALAGISGGGSLSPVAAAPSATAVAPSSVGPTATSGPTSTPTFDMAPIITSARPTQATSSVTPDAGVGGAGVDLGLDIPVDIVPCNGKYLTIYYSAIAPATYAIDIQSALDSFPGSRYLTTEGSCSALNQISKDGTRIYGVYGGPYSSAALACQARARVAGSYVKVMNPSIDPDATVPCD